MQYLAAFPEGEVFGKLCLLTLFVCLSISRGRRNKIKDFSSLSSKKQHLFFVLHIKAFSLLYRFIAAEYWNSYLISRNYVHETNCEVVFFSYAYFQRATASFVSGLGMIASGCTDLITTSWKQYSRFDSFLPHCFVGQMDNVGHGCSITRFNV